MNLDLKNIVNKYIKTMWESTDNIKVLINLIDTRYNKDSQADVILDILNDLADSYLVAIGQLEPLINSIEPIKSVTEFNKDTINDSQTDITQNNIVPNTADIPVTEIPTMTPIDDVLDTTVICSNNSDDAMQIDPQVDLLVKELPLDLQDRFDDNNDTNIEIFTTDNNSFDLDFDSVDTDNDEFNTDFINWKNNHNK